MSNILNFGSAADASQPGSPGSADSAGFAGSADGAQPSAGTAQGTPGAEKLIVTATDQTFQQILELSKTVPVVVDLWAEWCGPCKQLTPVLEKAVLARGGRLVLAKVNVDDNPGLAQAFKAQSIPMVVALIGGQAMPLFNGAIPEAQVQELLDKLLGFAAENGVTGSIALTDSAQSDAEPEPEPLSEHHQAAFDAISANDFETAAEAYRRALAENPRDTEAQAGLAQVSLLQRMKGKTAADIRNLAAAEPENLEAQMSVADLDLSGGHVDDAFGRLLDLYPSCSAEDKEQLRLRILEYFEVAGEEDPRVRQARLRLSNLLY